MAFTDNFRKHCCIEPDRTRIVNLPTLVAEFCSNCRGIIYQYPHQSANWYKMGIEARRVMGVINDSLPLMSEGEFENMGEPEWPIKEKE